MRRSHPAPADDFEDRVRWWIDNDPDPDTAAELRGLLETGDVDGLVARFDPPLRFGTAGVRGPMGAGPAHMNRLVVRLTAEGFVDVVGQGATIVVGYDRRHRSRAFAEEVAAVVGAGGGRALLCSVPVPTPVLAWSVTHLGADAGVMITASHNPPTDNGFKAYDATGAQILPPTAAEVEAEMEARLGGPVPRRTDPVGAEAIDATILEDYLDAIVHPALSPGISELTVAYSAMHGVGGETTRRLADRLGFELSPVASQFDPDPDFPTLAFPNPEEPGAMSLLIDHAVEIGADVAIAHDPDADRLAIATVDGGRWRRLSGNEVGLLLGDHLLGRSGGEGRIVSTTVVSSTALDHIAAAHGARCVRTLTGSKWVVRPGIDMPEHRFVFGYEEALGYAVNAVVHEKDGVSAAMEVLDLVASLRALGATLIDGLDELARRHGRFGEAQRTVRIDDADAHRRVSQGVAALRSAPTSRIDGRDVTVTDYASGVGDLPATDMVELDFGGSGRVLIRPSGTEPKLKIYAEALADATLPREEADARAAVLADAVLAAL